MPVLKPDACDVKLVLNLIGVRINAWWFNNGFIYLLPLIQLREKIMDVDTSKPCELDTVVIVTFGQDCDLIDENCNFDELLNDYLRTSSPFSLRMLLANLDEIENQTDGYDVLIQRYSGEFAPERWDMSPEQWLKAVKSKIIEHLHAGGHSSELSGF